MKKVFIDASILVEYSWPEERRRNRAERELRRLVEDAKRSRVKLATSHVALGETLQVIYQSFEQEKEWKTLFNLGKIFSSELYEISSTAPEELKEAMERVMEKDSRLEQNDCVIIAQAVSSQADVIKTMDKGWSNRIEELGLELDVY